ncbi:hypothetical protein [Williamsia muralis]|uniref:hypothetical protein n=1 Tax=Williamsia marianensis TaxID=85044 RepID=UPI00068D3D85|nr:hypothetical protein [Williamsia muralis]
MMSAAIDGRRHDDHVRCYALSGGGDAAKGKGKGKAGPATLDALDEIAGPVVSAPGHHIAKNHGAAHARSDPSGGRTISRPQMPARRRPRRAVPSNSISPSASLVAATADDGGI